MSAAGEWTGPRMRSGCSYLCPVWVMLVSVLLFGERVSGPDLRMFLFCIGGVGLILACEMYDGSGLYANVPRHLIGDDVCSRGSVHAWYAELGSSVVDRAESFSDCFAACTVGLG